MVVSKKGGVVTRGGDGIRLLKTDIKEHPAALDFIEFQLQIAAAAVSQSRRRDRWPAALEHVRGELEEEYGGGWNVVLGAGPFLRVRSLQGSYASFLVPGEGVVVVFQHAPAKSRSEEGVEAGEKREDGVGEVRVVLEKELSGVEGALGGEDVDVVIGERVGRALEALGTAWGGLWQCVVLESAPHVSLSSRGGVEVVLEAGGRWVVVWWAEREKSGVDGEGVVAFGGFADADPWAPAAWLHFFGALCYAAAVGLGLAAAGGVYMQGNHDDIARLWIAAAIVFGIGFLLVRAASCADGATRRARVKQRLQQRLQHKPKFQKDVAARATAVAALRKKIAT